MGMQLCCQVADSTRYSIYWRSQPATPYDESREIKIFRQEKHLLMSQATAPNVEVKMNEPIAIVVFGATGDLAKRKLLPALYRLLRENHLPEKFLILGVSRLEMQAAEFTNLVRNALEASSEVGPIDENIWQTFSASLEYMGGEFAETETFNRLARTLERHVIGNHLYYLSTPPSTFPLIAQGLGTSGLSNEEAGFRRIIIEKPFGTSLSSAKELNRVLHAVFAESQIYRIDHFLGKETVQNLVALRFANTIFEPILNRSYVDHVQITVAESLGIEGRGAFYEEAGIMRDIIQNHMIQLVALTALEPPVPSRSGEGFHPMEADALRDEKLKIVRALREVENTTQIQSHVVLGQYTAGNVDGQTVVAYRQEEKVAPDSKTPTFAALKLEIDNWRWSGVPFFVRSGKRMPRKLTEIAIVFKEPPLHFFPSATAPNALVVTVQPEECVSLQFVVKQPGLENTLRNMDMKFSYKDFGDSGPTAYERLILDCLDGDASLFPREDEVEESWAWIDPVLQNLPEPKNYSAGTWGPSEADTLMETRTWRNQPD